MLDRRTVSTYGVLFVLAMTVVGGTGVSTVVAIDSAATDDQSQHRVESVVAGPPSVASASDHSRASYPDAPEMRVARGDIAAIATGIERSETGTVTIDARTAEFNVTLSFANNDGRKPATLYVNTYLAGNESAVADLAYTAGDSDRVAVENRESVSGAPMPPGTYDVTVETGSETTTDQLIIDGPSVEDLTLLRAPGDRFDDLATDSDVTAARASGVVTDPPVTSDGPQAALGDTMVYRLNASGFFGLMAAQGGASAEENFLAVTRGDGSDRALTFDIRGREADSPVVDIAESVDDGSLRVIPDAKNETLYVTADLREVAREGGTERPFTGTGEAAYTFLGGTHITDANITSDVAYAVADREYSYEGDDGVLRRETASGQSVAGETTLAPETRLTLAVDQIGGDYETETETTVEADGAFETDIDLSGAPDDARYTLSIEEIDRSETLLTTGNGPETAVWFVEDRTSAGETDRIDGVRGALEDGGFLAVYAVPADEQVRQDDLVGHSEYLQPGVRTTSIALDEALTDSENIVVAAHRDTDDDGQFDYPANDSPYRIDGEAVYTAGRVVLSGDTSPPRNPQYLRLTLPNADEIDGTPVPTEGTGSTATPEPTATPSPTPTAEPIGTTELPPPTIRGDETPRPDGTTVPAGPNGTATMNGTATPTATAVAGTDGTGGGSSVFGPGFGPVATAVAAVLALGLLGRRD